MIRADPECAIPGTRLVPATESDCAAIAALARRAHSHPWSERQYRESIEAGHQCWIFRRESGEAIACCVISRLFDEAEILDIAVCPDWRRRGVAEFLLKAVFARLPADTSRVLLEVRASNLAALSLYRKLGFSEDGVRENYYPAAGGAREDAVLMSLSL